MQSKKRHLQSGGSQVFSVLGSRKFASERTTHVHMTSCRCKRTKIACARKVPHPVVFLPIPSPSALLGFRCHSTTPSPPLHSASVAIAGRRRRGSPTMRIQVGDNTQLARVICSEWLYELSGHAMGAPGAVAPARRDPPVLTAILLAAVPQASILMLPASKKT